MKDGCLTLDGCEIRIFHFVLAKGRRYFKFIEYTPGISHYLVTDTGFYTKDFARRFHHIIGIKRKLVAMFQSLAMNGFLRIIK